MQDYASGRACSRWLEQGKLARVPVARPTLEAKDLLLVIRKGFERVAITVRLRQLLE